MKKSNFSSIFFEKVCKSYSGYSNNLTEVDVINSNSGSEVQVIAN